MRDDMPQPKKDHATHEDVYTNASIHEDRLTIIGWLGYGVVCGTIGAAVFWLSQGGCPL